MSLSSKAIDRLFERLSATYGREWFDKWAGLEPQAVKALWGHELAPFADRLDAIAWALENLPERCPNAIQFRALCRQAPAPQVHALLPPRADPERVARELAKLAPAVTRTDRPAGDHKRWARDILQRAASGRSSVSYAALSMARRALGMPEDAPSA